jgi:hypothetical protein
MGICFHALKCFLNFCRNVKNVGNDVNFNFCFVDIFGDYDRVERAGT